MPKVIITNNTLVKTFDIEENKSILELSRHNNIKIEGSCEGNMACSTCHVIIDRDWVLKLPPPCIEEKEMLSLLTNYKENSRLGCQIIITKKLNGLKLSIPEEN